MSRNIIISFAFLCLLVNVGCYQEHEAALQTYTLPKFETDSQQFCFLNFPAGDSKQEAVLIVTDGSRLYVDRNGNQDLTEPDEFVVSARKEWQSDRDKQFQIDQVRVGGFKHRAIRLDVSPLEKYDYQDQRIKDLLVQRPNACSYRLSAEIQDDRFRDRAFNGRVAVSVGISDSDGVLQFGNSIKTAPTINLCGDLEIRLSGEGNFRPDAEADIVTIVGTPGDDPGTFALIGYESVIPEHLHPNAILEVTSKETGQTKKTQVELSHRC